MALVRLPCACTESVAPGTLRLWGRLTPVSLGGGTGAGELVARAPRYEDGAVCCQPEPRGPEHGGCRGADETLRVSAARLVTCGYLPLKDCKLLCGIKLKQAALPGN